MHRYTNTCTHICRDTSTYRYRHMHTDIHKHTWRHTQTHMHNFYIHNTHTYMSSQFCLLILYLVAICQMSSGPHGSNFFWKDLVCPYPTLIAWMSAYPYSFENKFLSCSFFRKTLFAPLLEKIIYQRMISNYKCICFLAHDAISHLRTGQTFHGKSLAEVVL